MLNRTNELLFAAVKTDNFADAEWLLTHFNELDSPAKAYNDAVTKVFSTTKFSAPRLLPLFDINATQDSPSDDYLTALQIAILRNNEKMVKLLIAHRADVNKLVYSRWSTVQTIEDTTLSLALYPYNSKRKIGTDDTTAAKFIQILLDNGANPEYRVGDGNNTALQHAAWAKFPTCIKILMGYGLNPYILNCNEKNVIAQAKDELCIDALKSGASFWHPNEYFCKNEPKLSNNIDQATKDRLDNFASLLYKLLNCPDGRLRTVLDTHIAHAVADARFKSRDKESYLNALQTLTQWVVDETNGDKTIARCAKNYCATLEEYIKGKKNPPWSDIVVNYLLEKIKALSNETKTHTEQKEVKTDDMMKKSASKGKSFELLPINHKSPISLGQPSSAEEDKEDKKEDWINVDDNYVPPKSNATHTLNH